MMNLNKLKQKKIQLFRKNENDETEFSDHFWNREIIFLDQPGMRERIE